MLYEIKMNGRVPSKKNSKRRIQRGQQIFMVPSEAHEIWHREQMMALDARLGGKWRKPPIAQNVDRVEIEFIAPDKRKADLSNKAESIMDLLVDAGVLQDDSWFVVPQLVLSCYRVDAEDAGAKIKIYTKV